MKPLDLGVISNNSEESLQQVLDNICAQFNLDYAAYAGVNTIDNSIHGVVNYPDAWKEHYVEQGFQDIDPTLAMAAKSVGVVDWTRLQRIDGFRKVFCDASEFGIGSTGMTIPVRGPYGDRGMFSVVRTCSEAEWTSLRNEITSGLQTHATLFHDRLMRHGRTMSEMRQPALSDREKEILQWIAAGKSQTDVGIILTISTRTVEVHLRSAREKLGALTTPQAVARAIGMGMIYPI
ncbi:LuxR family transcriptional regulator [Roseinatronobacter sp.]|uniref:LuxR family transcriptional regulator n=1 Tax=Roseinatronobacter sp. TaxID=1945755 RepID=UPI0025FA4CAE|nr:LuxR family transcriptional regulator [Rhodobaca sp.]